MGDIHLDDDWMVFSSNPVRDSIVFAFVCVVFLMILKPMGRPIVHKID